MTRHRLLAAPLAPVAALMLAACAAEPRAPSAPAANYPTSSADAPMSAGPNDLEGQIAALGAAEAQLDRAIRRSPAAPSRSVIDQDKAEHERDGDREPTMKSSPKGGEAAPQKMNRAGDDSLAGADPCVTACSALSSMERATKHLCDLTGEGDARCDSARSRVSGATERVTASCPACAGSR